jgi:hypothetical protein
MKLIGATFCLAAMCAAGLGAQTQTTESKTKVEVKDGTEVTLDGCLKANPGGGFMLTTTEGALKYALATDDDLTAEIGHRVEVTGKAADVGDGKVKIDSTVVGTSGKAEAKTEVKGENMAGMRYLSVKSLKTISASCM